MHCEERVRNHLEPDRQKQCLSICIRTCIRSRGVRWAVLVGHYLCLSVRRALPGPELAAEPSCGQTIARDVAKRAPAPAEAAAALAQPSGSTCSRNQQQDRAAENYAR